MHLNLELTVTVVSTEVSPQQYPQNKQQRELG